MDRQQLLKKYTKHLEQSGYEQRSIEHLLLGARRFLEWLEDENLTYKECTYNDLLAMLKMYRNAKKSITFRNRHLWCLRRFYEYLIKSGKADYNPALNIQIKGEVKTLPHDLLSREQMNEIYEQYQPTTPVQKRNKVMLSLFFYQGIIRQELDRLETTDINLKKGTILIKRNSRLQRRLLNLEAHQILLFQEYLQEIRPKLLKLKKKKSDKLFISIGDSDYIIDITRELLNELQAKHPELKSFLHVRLSLITHWVDERNIREAQYMAGHNSIISKLAGSAGTT
ncbi:tyrosine-type recombinase/integrase [Bacteroidota bacterium]